MKPDVFNIFDSVGNTNVPIKLASAIAEDTNLKIIDRNLGISSILEFSNYLLTDKKFIVHSHHIKSAFILRFVNSLLKFFKRGNDCVFIHTFHRDVTTLSPLYRMLCKYICLRSDHIIFNSNATRSAFLSMNFNTKCAMSVIYNGVDERIFYNNSPSSVRNIPLQLIAVGRLIPIKNHAVLIQAAKNLMELGFDFYLRILGAGSEYNRLRALISELNLQNHVHLCGEIDFLEVADYLRSADFFIMPSFSEGFGNASVEAAMCGCSLILSNIKVHHEIFKENALYFNPHSSEQLVNVILKNYDNKLLFTEYDRFTLGSAIKNHLLVYRNYICQSF